MIRKAFLCVVLCLYLNQVCSAEPTSQVTNQKQATSSVRDLFAPKDLGSCLKAVLMIPWSLIMAVANRIDIVGALGAILVSVYAQLEILLPIMFTEAIRNIRAIYDTINICTGGSPVSALFGQRVARSACTEALKEAGSKILHSLWQQTGRILWAIQNVGGWIMFSLIVMIMRLGNDARDIILSIVKAYVVCTGGTNTPLLGFVGN